TVDGLSMDRLVTGFGVAQAADQAWKKINGTQGAKVSLQGFGSVGGSCARYLQKMGYKVVAISDINGMYYNEDGLDIQDLLDARNLLGEVDVSKMKKSCEVRNRDEWLGLDVDIVIPAAVEDIINKDTARTVKASLIVEGANIPTTEEADV
ncbi:glutamate dehydrogenase (NAD(P)+), partial [gut metagenome]